MGGDPNGEHFDLNTICRRLVRFGSLEDSDDEIHFTWAADDYRVLTYSPLMKVVAISYLADMESTPEEVMDALVYEAVQRIREGRRTFLIEDVRKWKEHPSMDKLKDWMQGCGMRL